MEEADKTKDKRDDQLAEKIKKTEKTRDIVLYTTVIVSLITGSVFIAQEIIRDIKINLTELFESSLPYFLLIYSILFLAYRYVSKKNDDSLQRNRTEKLNEIVLYNSKLEEENLELRKGVIEEEDLIDKKLIYISREKEKVINDLQDEINRLLRYSRVHLVIALGTTIIAIGVLTYTLLTIDPSQKIEILYYIPRILLSVFIELFSFYFLRLYKSNFSDVKYYMNEITNVRMKTVSLLTSIAYGQKSLEEVIKELVNTERNFILKKDESTVEIQKSIVESNQSTKLLETLMAILNTKK